MQFGPLKLKRCRYGWMLYDGPIIGACFDLYGEYSESECDLMRRFVRPGDTAVDVGANIGDLTVPLAQMVGPQGFVYAVESQAGTFNVLCANLALNRIANVLPLNAFVKSDKTPPKEERFVSKNLPAPLLKIDELALTQCRLIKIDVDGGELEVIKSAAGTIGRLRPVLYFENDVQAESKSLLEYTMALEYDLYWHLAPVFRPDNFFGNPVNHWAPRDICSLMIVGLPKESGLAVDDLPAVTDPGWWPVQYHKK
jgi:FkbM family methyltransferase